MDDGVGFRESRLVYLADRDPQGAAKLALAREIHLPVWLGLAEVQKWAAGPTYEDIVSGLAGPPDEIVHGTPNLLLWTGASFIWQVILGNGTTTAGQNHSYFNAANACIAVGSSATAAAASQIGMQDLSFNRKGMVATYPQHTAYIPTNPSDISTRIVFRASFEPGEATITWNEWGLVNSLTGGRFLNRKVEAFGAKAAGATWLMTATITLS